MRLKVGAIFWSVALVSAVSYVVCAGFVALAPGATTRFFGYVMHVDLTTLARHITWGSFFVGLVCYSFVIAILAGASAWVYDRLVAA